MHMVVIVCFCLSVSMSFVRISLQQLKLGAKTAMQVEHDNLFEFYSVKFRINALLCSYGVICSP